MPKKKRKPRGNRDTHPGVSRVKGSGSKSDQERRERLAALDEHAAQLTRAEKARSSDPLYDYNHQKSDPSSQRLVDEELSTRRCYARPGKSSGWDNKPRRRFKPGA